MEKLLTDIKVQIKMLKKLQKTSETKMKTTSGICNREFYESEVERLNDVLLRIDKHLVAVEDNSNVRYYKREMFDELAEIRTIDSERLEKIMDDFEVRKYGYENGDLDDWSGESCEMKEFARRNE